MSVPCSIRIDYNTIMADPELNKAIKAMGPRIEQDEELVMGLYFMRQRVLGAASSVYHSLQTATPPDLAMSWKQEEIEFLQDRTTIECVLKMRKVLDETCAHVYDRIRATDSFGMFCPAEISAETDKERFHDFFTECFQSAATRYIQYEYHLKYMTYMPIIECSNFTPDKLPPRYECVDAEGSVLASCDLGYPSTYGIPGLEVHLGRHIEEVKKELPKLVSEKEFDILDDHSFFFEPEDSHMLRIVASEDLKAGEQMPYHYGWCNNRFFLINYGFHIPSNPMDAIVIKIRHTHDGQEKIVLLHRDGKQKKFLSLC